jgi:hypothetical protein
MTVGAMHNVGHLRKSIRRWENQIRAIDPMVEAVDRRLPGPSVTS